MVLVTSAAGDSYCIDSTEVTQSQYEAFLSASPSANGQRPECGWNTDFVPAFIPGARCFYEGTKYDPAKTPDHPVACVDWCDASAYCAWAGKRLCGRIGGGGVAPSEVANATESEWFNACSHQGQLAYPYGATYDKTKCNVGLPIKPFGEPSSKFPGCEGGFPGLFQMSSNVSEWEASCSDQSGAADPCAARGGSSGSPPDELTCAAAPAARRDTISDTLGIRCCASAI